MTFSDIFKSSFLDNVTDFSVTDILLAMLFAFAVGLFVFWVYKKTFTGVMYSTGFALTLVGLTLVTTLVILAVTSNVVLSLGMVGALSIVRFRAAIKEPIEIVFLFWSIAAGIVIGAGLIPMALIGSVIIGAILLLFTSRKVHESPYILVVNCAGSEPEKSVMSMIEEHTLRRQIKTKTVTGDAVELTVEVRMKDASTEFVNQLLGIAGVQNATLVSYNGDYMV
jgi:uncharacterized membrane protein YhiD involved in acid resistance